MSKLIQLIKKRAHKAFDTNGLLDDLLKLLKEDHSAITAFELEASIHLFYTTRKFNQLANLLNFLEENNIKYNKALCINLVLENNFNSLEVSTEQISTKDSLVLLNRNCKEAGLKRFIEQKRLKLHERQKALKESLLEKFEFFRTQHLEDKSKEVLAELLESFPSEKSLKKYVHSAKEKNYEKIISRTAKESLKSAETSQDEAFNKEDLKITQTWFSLWKEAFGDKNGLLLREQMGFLDSDEDPLLTSGLLEIPQLDIWDKVELLYKTKRYYEGLIILDNLESEVLANQPEMVYNFYYYKALMLKGAGLEKEALSILEAIIEQNASFRDVKYLHKKWQ